MTGINYNVCSVKGIPAVFLGSAQDEKKQSIEGILKYVNELNIECAG